MALNTPAAERRTGGSSSVLLPHRIQMENLGLMTFHWQCSSAGGKKKKKTYVRGFHCK